MFQITTNLVFSLIGLFFLLKLSWDDLKKSEVENKAIVPLFFIGVVFSIINNNLLTTALLMAFMWLLGVYLWKKEVFGGADVKILPCIVPFMNFSSFPDAFTKMLLFMVAFGLIGTIYGLIAKKILKRENVPFVPIITLTYILIIIYNFY